MQRDTMFDYMIGDVVEVGVDYIVLENNGIGYMISTSRASVIDIGDKYEKKKIYTHLNVREDDISIYGFTTREEIDMFRLLQTVSKIGPRVALGVLSTLTTLDIKLAIVNDDIATLSKSPGVGKKTAERIILELRDKVKIDENVKVQGKLPIELNDNIDSSEDEVIQALISLGYTQSEVYTAFSRIQDTEKTTEELIKLTLKELSK